MGSVWSVLMLGLQMVCGKPIFAERANQGGGRWWSSLLFQLSLLSLSLFNCLLFPTGHLFIATENVTSMSIVQCKGNILRHLDWNSSMYKFCIKIFGVFFDTKSTIKKFQFSPSNVTWITKAHTQVNVNLLRHLKWNGSRGLFWLWTFCINFFLHFLNLFVTCRNFRNNDGCLPSMGAKFLQTYLCTIQSDIWRKPFLLDAVFC